MAIEIERKFLVTGDAWKQQASHSLRYEQGYLADTGSGTVRARLEGDKARLNIKSAGIDIQRLEFEYEIPVADAREILENLCGTRRVSKTRYFVPMGEFVWEIDEFDGFNQGLVVAEIELKSRDQEFPRPDWVGEEVSSDSRYLNNNLAKSPYTTWQV